MMYKKQCSVCNRDVFFSSKKALSLSIRRNSDCKKCSAIKKGPRDRITKQKISKTLMGRVIPRDVVERRAYSQKVLFNTPEYKQKFSELHRGENNGMYGKHHDEKSRSKISELTLAAMCNEKVRNKHLKSHRTKKCREKLSNALTGRQFSPETKQKMREAVVRRVQKYGVHTRNFSPYACGIIDDYGKANGYNFQHALNGGEHSCVGYFVDGYDKNKNVVIEIDEHQHFDSNGDLLEKDIRRQRAIEEYLHCRFIRIPFKEKTY